MANLREKYLRENPIQDYVSTTGIYGERSLFTAIKDLNNRNIELYFDFISRTAKDVHGTEYDFVKPPCDAWIREFHEICQNLGPPRFFMDRNGTLRLTNHPEIYYDIINNYWKNEYNGVHIIGLGSPIVIIE